MANLTIHCREREFLTRTMLVNADTTGSEFLVAYIEGDGVVIDFQAITLKQATQLRRFFAAVEVECEEIEERRTAATEEL